MRGLDGSTPSAEDQSAKSGGDSTDGKKEEWQHPVGASQLDYIRRQAQALRRLDRRRELRAIGVVGTDLYDKQLILQALRSEFPGILFFTTDLDSRLLHSSQYHWSRNLLIASAFGLELDAKLQGRAPPFRDSYQTATFLAARASLFDGIGDSRLDPERLESELQPRVFEIARGGAYDITPREYASDLHAAPSEAQENLGFLPWIVLSALVLFLVTSGAVARIRELFCDLEERTWRCALVAASAAGLLAIAVFPLVFRAAWTPPSDGGEPLVFAEGISVWPTESVRVLVFLVSVLGIVFGAAALERNKRCLRQTLGLTPPKKGEALGFRGSLEQSQWIPCRTRDDAQREGDATRPEPVDAGEEWKRYLLNGRLLPSFGRVTVMVLAYFTLGGMLFAIWGTPHNPLRGAQAMILDRLALILSVVSLAALIFFVVDATRECGIFIEALSKRTSRWPKGVRKRLGEKLDLREEDLAEWLDIQLITSRTRVVGNLILVPFVAILLMVLSRNHYFDDWEWPVSLIAIFSIQAVFPLAAAVRMRRAAERARGAVLSRLELRLTHRLGLISQKGQAECRQLEGLQRTIREVREGAFSPWFQSPAVRAVLMPFGGIGALAVLDILAKGGI